MRFLRYLSWAVSLGLHGALAVLFFLYPQIGYRPPSLEPVVNLELLDAVEEPEPAPEPILEQALAARPEPPPEPSRPTPPRPPEPSTATPPAVPGPVAAAPAPTTLVAPPPPGFVHISPVKRQDVQYAPEPPPRTEPEPENAPKPPPEIDLAQGRQVQVGEETLTVKEGKEQNPLRALLVREFSPSEFTGSYRLRGAHSDRFLHVIDGREVYGKLLIFDPGRGTYRTLNKFGNLAYVFGASFDNQQPVTGTVIFLATKDHTKVVSNPSRIMYQPDGRTSDFAFKVYFRERMARLRRQGATLSATLIQPPEPGNYPGLILMGGRHCLPPIMAREFGRLLALRGLVVLVLDGRGCYRGQGNRATASEQDLAQDAAAAYRYLASRQGVRKDRIGFWGVDDGARLAVAAAAMDTVDPAFLVGSCSAMQPADRPRPAAPPGLDKVRAPILWLMRDDRRPQEQPSRLGCFEAPEPGPAVVSIPNHPDLVAAEAAGWSGLNPWLAEAALPWILERVGKGG